MTIIIPGAPPQPKELCQKAQARGLPCTTDQCDHAGGYIALMLDGLNFVDTNFGPCRACGAEKETDVFARAKDALDALGE
jgi:hypothetical protein